MDRKILSEINKMKQLFKAEHGRIIIREQNFFDKIQQAASQMNSTARSTVNPSQDAGTVEDGKVGTGLFATILGYFKSVNKDGVSKIIQSCSSTEMGGATQDTTTLNSIADGINAAIEGIGTDEESIKLNIQKLASIPDFCAMAKIYQQRHGETLFDALDSDIDIETDWKNYVYLPLSDLAQKSKAKVGTGVVTPKVKSTTPPVKQRFEQSAKELDPSSPGTMDAKNLEKILKTLEGGTPAAAAPAPTGGAPDTALLQSALQQLSA